MSSVGLWMLCIFRAENMGYKLQARCRYVTVLPYFCYKGTKPYCKEFRRKRVESVGILYTAGCFICCSHSQVHTYNTSGGESLHKFFECLHKKRVNTGFALFNTCIITPPLLAGLSAEGRLCPQEGGGWGVGLQLKPLVVILNIVKNLLWPEKQILALLRMTSQ